MESSSRSEATRLLKDWSDGRQEALDKLLPQIYAELRRLASSYLRRERADHTLQATALVHEAFIKLVDQRAVRWQNRAHFFGIAAQAMRRILVDHARAHAADKRGSGERRSRSTRRSFWLARPMWTCSPSTRCSQAGGDRPSAEPRRRTAFFGGLTMEETAEVMNISPATVGREWTLAKAWLFAELSRTS